jgi:hypothetical protein
MSQAKIHQMCYPQLDRCRGTIENWGTGPREKERKNSNLDSVLYYFKGVMTDIGSSIISKRERVSVEK